MSENRGEGGTRLTENAKRLAAQRALREAQALRVNLARRKAQSRARADAPAGGGGSAKKPEADGGSA